MPPEIQRLTDQFLQAPVRIEVSRPATAATTIVQMAVIVPGGDWSKRETLRRLIRENDVKNAIVFCNRKRDVDVVAKSLTKHGFSAAALHGDLDQSVRTKTLDAFRACEISILVASDVAARGLDIPSVGHIFNFDVPFHADDYVHRIGRTGRAGRTGHAFMLVNRRDEKNVAAIEKLIGTKIASRVMEGLPEEEPRRDSGKAAERGRGRGHERSRRRGGDSRPRTEHTEHRSRPEQNAVAVAAALPVMPVREERPAKARDPHQQRTVAKPRPAAATAAVPKPVDISELPAFLLRPVRLPPRRAKTPVSQD